MDNEGDITLPQHEMKSEHRAHKLGEKIHELKEEIMSTDNTAAILAAMGNRGVDGAGLGMGGGLIGGVVLGALLGGNRGLLGGAGAVEPCVTPMQLTSGLASVIDSNQNTTLLQSVGDVKAAVPLAEAQVQLALAGAQSDLTNLINTANVANLQGQFAINKNVSDTTAQIIAAEVATQVAVGGAVTSGLQNTFALSNLIRDDGDKTRALLITQNETMLNRQLAVAEAALLEERSRGRSRETEVNVSQVVNQTQAQAQAQNQQQQQLILLSQIAAGFHSLQNAVATNSNLIVGNSGATTTGPQTANPVNVRT